MSLRRSFSFTPLGHNVHYSNLRNVHCSTDLYNVHYAKVMLCYCYGFLWDMRQDMEDHNSSLNMTAYRHKSTKLKTFTCKDAKLR